MVRALGNAVRDGPRECNGTIDGDGERERKSVGVAEVATSKIDEKGFGWRKGRRVDARRVTWWKFGSWLVARVPLSLSHTFSLGPKRQTPVGTT